jgi:transposase
VTEYRIVTRICAACGAVATATPPGCPPARIQYGPTVAARAAELVCAHYLTVVRAARLMRSMAGVPVSVGFMASIRGRAARMLEQAFLSRVRQLLRQAGVLDVDETPVRAAGGLHYVHVAATQHLTAFAPADAPRPTSTPGLSCPDMPARSCATATPAMPTSSTPTTPGAERT